METKFTFRQISTWIVWGFCMGIGWGLSNLISAIVIGTIINATQPIGWNI